MNLREHLEQKLGLVISNDWYDDCYTALQQQQPHITMEMIFEQMLYHDLRDIVRGNNAHFEIPTEQPSQALSDQAQLLRNAITKSMEQSATHKITLPSSFRCCLQIEEICDVSKNSESRFSSPTATMSLSSCHKLCLIDGYYPGQAMVAMEVAPLVAPGAGVPKLFPGTKVLLFGPVIVRHGMIGLHSGNCLILGGLVERLVHIQRQAIEKAKQLSGHGIDPTIRALIWNNRHTDNDENDVDEGRFIEIFCCKCNSRFTNY
jgi:RecQ mediated genome instability protein